MSLIEDGTGTGNKLQIDASNRAKIEGVTKSIGQAATEREDSFNINSGLCAGLRRILHVLHREVGIFRPVQASRFG